MHLNTGIMLIYIWAVPTYPPGLVTVGGNQKRSSLFKPVKSFSISIIIIMQCEYNQDMKLELYFQSIANIWI